MTGVLVLRALGLGDFLTGIPALRLLRLALPKVAISLAAPAYFGVIALDAGIVDEVVDYDGLLDLPPLLAGVRPPHIAIDLHGNGPASRSVLAALAPDRLIAYTTEPSPQGTSVWNPHEHEVLRWCRLVAEAFGVPADAAGGVPGSLPLPQLPAHLPAGAIVVHPGASAPSRQWPADRFAAVATSLSRYGRQVIVTGSSGERAIVQRVSDASGARAVTGLSLEELFAMVGRAALVVSGDTGIAHVAATFGAPSVVLFGPVSPRLWGPPPLPIHRAISLRTNDDPAGDPHADRPDPALLRIPVSLVLDESAGALRAAGERQVTR
jgi:ADP-heptose:LPS heptosyltransferase